jgi:prevent-host-death family protein
VDKQVSAAEANRSFSRLLREVRGGQSVVVTAHGRPVARIVPVERGQDERMAARGALLRRLERQAVVDAERWTRDELYRR